MLFRSSVKEEWRNEEFLAVNYRGETRDELSEAERQAVPLEKDGILFTSKIQIVEVSGGEVVNSPAPKFYMEASSALERLFKIRNGWYDNGKGNFSF